MGEIFRYEYKTTAQVTGVWRQAAEIPAGIENLTLHIEAEEGKELPVGYFFLGDNLGKIRMQKMTWGKEVSLCVSEKPENTSSGCVPGVMEKGRWEFVFYPSEGEKGRFNISLREGRSGVTECIREECWCSGKGEGNLVLDAFDWDREYEKKPGWYKGDFHTHTRLSDGQETVAGAMENAKENHLDFYVPTEHNMVHTGWSARKSPMILPGMEVTTENGHCNLFGLDRQPGRLPALLEKMEGANAEEDMVELIREAKAQGWMTSINHPFLHIWKWKHDRLPLELVDFLEIVNDPTYQYAVESNDKAIRFLDFLWMNGHRIYGVGGSDSHNKKGQWYPGADGPSIPGDPGTFVRMDVMTPASLMKEMKKGHIYISRFCTMEVAIKAGEGEYLPGDEVPVGEKLICSFRIMGLDRAPHVWLHQNGKAIIVNTIQKADKTFEGTAELLFAPEEWNFARLEVRDEKGKFLAWTNPVYGGMKEPEFFTWQDALAEYEKQ